MLATTSAPPRVRLGATSPRLLAALSAVGLLCVTAIFFGGDLLRAVIGEKHAGLATLVGRDLQAIRPQVERFVADRGGREALTPRVFDDDRRGAAGVFDTFRTGTGRPVPPPAVFEGSSHGRYTLEVGDFTDGRGPDHVVVLRCVTEGVCRAFNEMLGHPADPFDVDPGDRYVRRKGCIIDPDTGEFVVFDVLYSS